MASRTKHQARNKFQSKKLGAIGSGIHYKQLIENALAKAQSRKPKNLWV